jgi:hypothetical protein
MPRGSNAAFSGPNLADIKQYPHVASNLQVEGAMVLAMVHQMFDATDR